MSAATPPVPQGELREVIDKLASFVARNGQEFERLTKVKQKDNPKFAFLLAGSPHHDYYTWRVQQELKNKRLQDAASDPSALGPRPMTDAQVQELLYIHIPKILSEGTQAAVAAARRWVLARSSSADHANQLILLVQKHHFREDIPAEHRLQLAHFLCELLHHSTRKGLTHATEAFRCVMVPLLHRLYHQGPTFHQPTLDILSLWRADGLFETSFLDEVQARVTADVPPPLYLPGPGSNPSVRAPIVPLVGMAPPPALQFGAPPAMPGNPPIAPPPGMPFAQQAPLVGATAAPMVPAVVGSTPTAAAHYPDLGFEPLSYGASRAYFQMPAALVVSLVKPEDYMFEAVDPAQLRQPSPDTEESIRKAVEDFYADFRKDKRDAEGWDHSALSSFYREKETHMPQRKGRRAQSQSPPPGTRGRSRSRSRSPPARRQQSAYAAPPAAEARPGLGNHPRPALSGQGDDMFAQFRQARSLAVRTASRSSEPTCYQCGQTGHIARDCR